MQGVTLQLHSMVELQGLVFIFKEVLQYKNSSFEINGCPLIYLHMTCLNIDGNPLNIEGNPLRCKDINNLMKYAVSSIFSSVFVEAS